MPTISGNAVQGGTLTAAPGTWTGDAPISFSYQWSDGQKGITDTLSAAEVGQLVTVTVTASNAAGQASATSAPVGPVLPAAPRNSRPPVITGTAQQGHTLTASTGVWSNAPTAYAYAWQQCSNRDQIGCSTISGATASTYALHASDVGKYMSVVVTASNSGGQASATSASVGPVLPPAPVNTDPPAITGAAQQGATLSVSNGAWSNNPTGYSYSWEDCNNSGTQCSAISGATSSSYVLSAADIGSAIVCVVTATGPGGSTSTATAMTAVVSASPIPVGALPTTTAILATPDAPVTNQGVTLIATVTVVNISTALWGAVTFENGGAAIAGCTGMSVTADGQSATVACAASFAASTAQLSAVFTPAAGSVLAGSASPSEMLTVGPDASSTSLSAPTSVNVGTATTYIATVTPPAARTGPVEPTGAVEFLDGGQPIASCDSRPLANGQAACTVRYVAVGAHSISARYSGDANFSGSTSPIQQVSAAAIPIGVKGAITSTMQWAFKYTPGYTMIRNLVVNGASGGLTVMVRCRGRGCPFASHATLLSNGMRCGKTAGKPCFSFGSFNITPAFAGHRLAVGSQVTVSITRPDWVGKSYRFTVRSGRGPRIQIGCLAPGAIIPGVGC